MFSFIEGAGHLFSIAELEKNSNTGSTHCGFLPYPLRLLTQIHAPEQIRPFQLTPTKLEEFQAVFEIIFWNTKEIATEEETETTRLVQQKISTIKALSQQLSLKERLDFVLMLGKRYKEVITLVPKLPPNTIELGSVSDTNLMGTMLQELFEQALARGEIHSRAEFESAVTTALLKVSLRLHKCALSNNRQLILSPQSGGYIVLNNNLPLTTQDQRLLSGACYQSKHPVLTGSINNEQILNLETELAQRNINLRDCYLFNMVAPAGLKRGQIIIGCGIAEDPAQVPHIHMTHNLLSAGGGWVIIRKQAEREAAASANSVLYFELVAVCNSSGTHQISHKDMKSAMALPLDVCFSRNTHDVSAVSSFATPLATPLTNISGSSSPFYQQQAALVERLEHREPTEDTADIVGQIIAAQATEFASHASPFQGQPGIVNGSPVRPVPALTLTPPLRVQSAGIQRLMLWADNQPAASDSLSTTETRSAQSSPIFNTPS